MNKIFLAIPLLLLSVMFTNVQRSATAFYNSMSRTSAIAIPMQDDEEEENLPTDSTFLNWIAKLFLWFIYASVGLMILAGTLLSIKSKRVWTWAVCLCFAFFYAMLLGRYWGYSECLVGFVILFSATKSFLLYTSKGRAWKAKHLD